MGANREIFTGGNWTLRPRGSVKAFLFPHAGLVGGANSRRGIADICVATPNRMVSI